MMLAQLTLLLILLTETLPAQTTGALTGCITDTANTPVAGATVIARAEGTRLTTQANADGCYEFVSLRPTLYRVTVRRRAFDNVTRDKIRVAPEQRQRLNFSMTTGPICDCEPPGKTLRQLAERATAVVYLKIADRDHDLAAPRGYFRQSAHVLEVLKWPATVSLPSDAAAKAFRDLALHDPKADSSPMRMDFLQDQSDGAPDPYDFGEEFVAFFYWWPAERIFEARTRHSIDRSDKDTVFVIQNGRVTRTPSSLKTYAGRPVEHLLAELRKVATLE